VHKKLAMSQPRHPITSTTLLGRVKNPDDHGGWQAFLNIYQRSIHKQALRAGLTADEAEEVTQETVIEIGKRIPEFNYDRRAGSFKGWVFQLTRWRILNQFKRRRSETISLECLPNQEEIECELVCEDSVPTCSDETLEAEWKQAHFEAALQSLRQRTPFKNFQIFDLLVFKRWNAARIASLFQTNRAHIYLVKYRLTAALKAEVRRIEREPASRPPAS